MASGTIEADSRGTVINVLAAALARPAVDTHTGVAPVGVEAGAPIVAGVGLQLALINILCAELSWGGEEVGRGNKWVLELVHQGGQVPGPSSSPPSALPHSSPPPPCSLEG